MATPHVGSKVRSDDKAAVGLGVAVKAGLSLSGSLWRVHVRVGEGKTTVAVNSEVEVGTGDLVRVDVALGVAVALGRNVAVG